MKKQFIMLITTGIFLILGWTIVEYLLQSQIQYQYQQISSYPVMIYSWDKEILDSLMADLKKDKYVREIDYKTGRESAAEMIKKYGLTGTEEILQEKVLPDMIIVYLRGDKHSDTNKLILRTKLDLLDKDRVMVEYQDDIWNITFRRIDQLSQIRWILTAFLSLVIFLVFLLKRLHYEHHLSRIKHLIRTQKAASINLLDHFWGNTLLLSLLPVLLSFFLYQIFYYNDWLLFSISAYFFLIQLAVVFAASLLAYPFVLKYKRKGLNPGETE